MNKKAKILVLSLAIVGSISIGAAAFVQFIPEVFSSNTDSGSAENETYIVRFADADNSILKRIECKKGDTLDILDAPRYSSNKVWKATTNDQDGNPVFLNTHPEINQPYVFKEVDPPSDKIDTSGDKTIEETGYNGNDVRKVKLISWDKYIYKNNWKTKVVRENASDRTNGQMAWNGSSKPLVNQKIKNTNNGIVGDTTIGLESLSQENIVPYDPYNNSEGTSQAKTISATPYKSKVYGSNVIGDTGTSNQVTPNYCPIRFQLQNDVVLSGAKLELAARVGVSGGDYNFPQAYLQNIINGAYVELDLNGYNLIVANQGENQGQLDVFGSITDSAKYDNSGREPGTIVLESGAEMWATMTVEDTAREDSYPTQYFYAGQPFSFFKSPYLDCNIIFKQGCKFNAKLGVRLGSDNSRYGLWYDVIMIGDKNSGAFFEFTSEKGGEIQRLVSYNDDMYIGGSDSSKRMLQDMQINYNLLSGGIKLNGFSMDFKYSTINGNMTTNRSPFYVPPYYRFHLYPGTNAEISNLYIFAPSSYLIIDEGATVTLSAGNKTKTADFGWNTKQYWYQPVGGLYFLDYYQPFSEAAKYIDTNKHDAGDSYGTKILKDDRNSQTNAFNFYNGYPAYCQLDGTIKTINAETPVMHKYTLAGNFKVSNFDAETNSFKSLIQQSNVQAFASVHQIGASRFTSGLTTGFTKINIIGYYNSPLIVNDYVVTPMNGETSFNFSKTRTYDRLNKLVNDTNGTKYAFIFDDVYSNTETNYVYSTNYYLATDQNESDPLTGKFLQAVYSETNDTINVSNQQYMLYQGVYLKSNIGENSEETSTSMTKVWGYGAGRKAKDFLGMFTGFTDEYLSVDKMTFKLDDAVLNQPITDAKKENGQVVYTRVSNKSWKLTDNLPLSILIN